MHKHFRINIGPVVFEKFDSESLAINLDSGAYYSMTGSSDKLWALLAEGASVEQIVEYFLAAHEGEPSLIAEAVQRFLGRLEAEQLIVEDVNASVADATPPVQSPAEKTPFQDFEISVFTDMQDLLLLDPIHDTDETGWPAPNPSLTR